MSIGTNIKKLRREQDMTQEQLAEYLGITATAVSQWECDRTAPDISQIPLLTRIFNVTADELLEISRVNKEQEIEALRAEIYRLSQKGYKKEAFEAARSACRTYPDSFRLMLDYAGQYYIIQYDESYPREEREAIRKECIRMLECIVDRCTDEKLRLEAIYRLSNLYADNGQEEKAVEFAMKLPAMVYARPFVLVDVQKGEARMNAVRSLIGNDLLQFLEVQMTRNFKTAEGSLYYSEEEICALHLKRIAILEILFEEGDYGFHNDSLRESHEVAARYYASVKDGEKVLFHLGCAADAAIRFLRDYYGKEYTHRSLLFRDYLTHGKDVWVSSTDNDATELLEFMENEIFDMVREDPRFGEIEEKLTAFAGIWEQ